MKRTTLLGSVAAGLLAAAAATPAWAQATTYPEGTDCSAIQNSASKTDCMNQMDESRRNPDNSTTTTSPATTAPGAAAAPANAATAPTGAAAPVGGEGAAPSRTLNSPTSTDDTTNGTTGGTTGTTTP